MKYHFYCKNIGNVSLKHVGAMLQHIPVLDFGARFFKPGAAISVSQDLTESEWPDLAALVNDAQAGMAQFCKPEYFLSGSIDRMTPNSYLNEHSDTALAPWSQHRHKIHIPLMTNDKVGFFWGDSTPQFRMRTGEVFIYNNTDRHSVANLSDEDRYHLILRYKPECFHVLPDGVDETTSIGQSDLPPHLQGKYR